MGRIISSVKHNNYNLFIIQQILIRKKILNIGHGRKKNLFNEKLIFKWIESYVKESFYIEKFYLKYKFLKFLFKFQKISIKKKFNF